MEGVPSEVSTSTGALKVTVTPMLSPGDQAPSFPAPLRRGVPSTVGGSTATCCPAFASSHLYSS